MSLFDKELANSNGSTAVRMMENGEIIWQTEEEL